MTYEKPELVEYAYNDIVAEGASPAQTNNAACAQSGLDIQ